MPMQKPTNPQNTPIMKVGHTTNGQFGNSPDKRVGGSRQSPTPVSFGK